MVLACLMTLAACKKKMNPKDFDSSGDVIARQLFESSELETGIHHHRALAALVQENEMPPSLQDRRNHRPHFCQ